MKKTNLLLRTILSDVGLGILSIYILLSTINNIVPFIVTLFSLGFIANYIKYLQTIAGIEKKIKVIGYISYLIACLVTFLVLI